MACAPPGKSNTPGRQRRAGLRRALRPAGRGRVSLSRQPAPDPPAARGQTQAEPGLRRGHRLRRAPRARPRRRAPVGHLPLGARAPQRAHQRSDGRREKLRRVRLGATGVPAGLPRSLPPRHPPARRAHLGARRRHLRPSARSLRTDRRPGHRRLGAGPTQEQERNDFLEIIDDRHGARSTIVASQLPPTNGTPKSATRPSPTPSATASFTTRTASC